MRIEVDIFPTEDVEKLKEMVLKVFPSASLEIKGSKLVGEADIEDFLKRIEEQRIRKTIKAIVEEKAEAGEDFLDLSKMAAICGKISLDADFPLGKIRVFFSPQEIKRIKECI